MSKKDTTYEKIERALYHDTEDAQRLLTPTEEAIRRRMMLCVAKKMESPLIEDQELVNYLMNGCGGNSDKVSQSQAYRDIGMINRLVGNITLAAKGWYRYMIVEGAKKAYQIAIDHNDAKGAAAALDKIGKYTLCDKEDNKFDFSKMVPPSFEPTDDITTLEGLEPIDNLEARRQELRSLAVGIIKNKAEDATIIEESEE